MNDCRLEADVLRAAEEGTWTDALRRHVTECEECEAAAAVARWMRDFSRVDEREHILPDPAVLWLKAQILRGSTGIDRVAKPMTVAQIGSYLTVAAGWTALLAWRWDALMQWFSALRPEQLFSGSMAAVSLSATFFLGVLVLSSLTIVVAMHTILAEE